jgi:hypothetical protein
MTPTNYFVIKISKIPAILAHSAIFALEVFELKIVKLRWFYGDFGKLGDNGPLY